MTTSLVGYATLSTGTMLVIVLALIYAIYRVIKYRKSKGNNKEK
jgi:heme/copper-type cytochrome/quinol oxidase subunit 2